jgi:hypothetical protein
VLEYDDVELPQVPRDTNSFQLSSSCEVRSEPVDRGERTMGQIRWLQTVSIGALTAHVKWGIKTFDSASGARS